MPLRLPPDLMVSVSGVRGRVGAGLTPELVAGVAAAFGAFLREEGADGPVVVGRDSRTSGPMLERAAVAGLLSVGVDVVAVGVVPTPTLMLAVEHHGGAGGIGITASHNPAEWNALKLASGEGMFLDGEASQRFRRFLADRDPTRAAWDALGTVSEDLDAVPRHLAAILELGCLDVPALRGRGFHVALDCVRGAGGPIMTALLEALGCRVTAIHLTPDGRFPRDPEPTADSLGELGGLVRESGADVGLAVDPDVDRLSLVDEAGRPLGEDLTLALAAAVVLGRTPGPVVTNLSTSQVLEDVARAHHAPLLRAPVGEINVARRMQSEGAVVGGEGNGGVILPVLHFTRDAPVGAALVLQHLCDTGLPLSAAAARWPAYAIIKTKRAFPRDALADAYRALESDLEADGVDRSDGLRFAWEKRRCWLHVRPSGTEPVVRLIAEAPEAEAARALVARAGEILEGVG
ncbi:MAG: phosphoglucosamine mutase [Longimicrobiales bacterium]|nr:phosphoglucosamine mutase [Longimicrobiales bacterium]